MTFVSVQNLGFVYLYHIPFSAHVGCVKTDRSPLLGHSALLLQQILGIFYTHLHINMTWSLLNRSVALAGLPLKKFTILDLRLVHPREYSYEISTNLK